MEAFTTDQTDIQSNFSENDYKNVKTIYGSMWISKHDEIIGVSLEKKGTFEEQSILEVVSFLKSKYGFTPITFIDIGANIGTHLVYALKKILFKKAIGIEPDPLNFYLLQKNIDCNGIADRSRIFNTAISDNRPVANSALSKTNFGDHQIQSANETGQNGNNQEDRKLISVRTDTFDNFILENKISTDSNTLVWIDTQGHEGHVLTGILNLEESRQPFVVLEFWPVVLEKRGRKETLMEYLKNCESVIDLRIYKWWWRAKSLSIDEILNLYDSFLSESNPDVLSHTDLLCIPKGTKLIHEEKFNIKIIFLIFINMIRKLRSLLLKK